MAEGLSNHAAALLTLTAGMAGSFDSATAAAAAAAAAALLQQPYHNSPAAAQQQLPTEARPGLPSPLGGPSHAELLQAALGSRYPAAADPAAAAAAAEAPAPAPAAATASAGGKAPGARKQRFTREQHAAILESVERNYAQYPSRYTELVIKEMQARFPGIELNNACVRKIKFR